MLGMFTNPFAYDVVISIEVEDFPKARRTLHKLLMEWSRNLKELDDQCVAAIAAMADILQELAAKFDIIKMIAYEEGAKPGRCYGLKCDVIRSTLHEVRRRLEKDPESRLQMAEVLDMLSKHIGRLSLSGYTAENVFAIRMDKMIDVVGKRFQETWPEEDCEGESKFLELYAIWNRLCVTMPSCGCLQCGKRRLANAER
ncbi:uncharacterized protein N7484_004706 [Penicillium longicatenatum]|uniref:uncharacterized protein n=1 Tax=Penicillium longicatenatum TaxID=1561947 RepID=UPI0025475537|nr:uncharacterized protein N7484_004706 [Penicillium longicatenatum]KAJ5650983.1 hypothetical protein N7484_004706 [Penicillium longicatenatum]